MLSVPGFSEEQINSAVEAVTKKELLKPLPKAPGGKPLLVVFRHGQSEDNALYQFSGWRDPSLTELGVRQAQSLAEKLIDYKFDLAVTSTLKRARQTLEVVLRVNKDWIRSGYSVNTTDGVVFHKADSNNINSAYPTLETTPSFRQFCNLSHDTRIVLDDRVIERSYGELQGTSKIELYLKDRETEEKYRRGYDFPAKNGESLKMVEQRTKLFLDELIPYMKGTNSNVVISCHSNSMRAIRKWLENLSTEEMCHLENPLGQDFASYTIK